ncbi:putative leader peptide [Jiangella endophytica]
MTAGDLLVRRLAVDLMRSASALCPLCSHC